MAELVFLVPEVVAVPLAELFVWALLAAFWVLVVPGAEAVLVLAVVGFVGGWVTDAVLVETLAVGLLAEPAGAEVPVVFGAFVAVADAGVLVLAAEVDAVAELPEVLAGALAFLFAAGAVLAVVVDLAADFAVAALPEVIVVLVAVGVALAGLETEALPTLVVPDEVTAL